MDVTRIRALRGPNLWSRHTAIEAVVACSAPERALSFIAGVEARVCNLFPAVGALLVLQRRGLLALLEGLGAWLKRRWPSLDTEGLRGLHDAIEASYRNPRGLWVGCAWHLAGWLGGVIEIYVMAEVINMPVTLGQALVIESLGQAIRAAAFFVPAGLGVQEGSLVWLAMQLGLSPATGLSLSLIKRVRELALGLPALLAWHWIETGRWSRFTRPAAEAQKP